jgi:hypothetical protein
MTGNPVAFDGSKVRFEFYCPFVNLSGATGCVCAWFMDGVPINSGNGYCWRIDVSSNVTAYAATYFRPPAGVHTFSLRAVSNGSVNFQLCVPGSATSGDGMYMRITKA